MIFVSNNLKYDTDKMELISEKCQEFWESSLTQMRFRAKDVKLYRSKNNNWAITYRKDSNTCLFARALTEDEAKAKLIERDLEKYEEIFGEIEEA